MQNLNIWSVVALKIFEYIQVDISFQAGVLYDD